MGFIYYLPTQFNRVFYSRSLNYNFTLADAPEHNYLFTIPAAALLGTYGYSFLQFGSLEDVNSATYLASSLCCIAAITALASQKTSRLGTIQQFFPSTA